MKNYELIEFETELRFIQIFSNINMLDKILKNFNKLVKENSELNDYKCEIEKLFDSYGNKITKIYYINFIPTKEQIKRYKKWANYYNSIISYLVVLTLLTLFIIYNFNAVLSLELGLILMCIMILPTYIISKYIDGMLINKLFKDIYKFKFKLNINKEEYEFLCSNLFEPNMFNNKFYYSKGFNSSIVADLSYKNKICELNIKIYGYDNLKHKYELLNKIDKLINLYRKNF